MHRCLIIILNICNIIIWRYVWMSTPSMFGNTYTYFPNTPIIYRQTDDSDMIFDMLDFFYALIARS